MPTDKDFKRRVRQRAAATGERYTEARAALAAGRTPPTATPAASEPQRWLALLGVPGQAEGAFALLQALPEDELRPLVLGAVTDADWRIRRSCCRLLDDLTLTPESIAALTARLDDVHPKVRRAALHSLACERCKPDGCALDIRPLFARMARDPSAAVRSMVVGTLSWQNDSAWAAPIFAEAAASDPSAEVRALAAHGLARLAEQARSEEARRALPEELRRKTERHTGKWVAVADGRIIGVQAYEGGLRRIIKGYRSRGEAAVYWVAPPPAPVVRTG